MESYAIDERSILTLDAGGTNFVFSAIQFGKNIVAPITLDANASNLDACLASLVNGFTTIINLLPKYPDAISFAFPGPADYPNGIISNDLPNFPAFSDLDGFPLGDFLAAKFHIPVYINNDGDLYALGEAMFGILPEINDLLSKNNSTRQYRNLIGFTLGTGFGAGIIVNKQLLTGDNACSAEVFALRNLEETDCFVEETISIRGIQRLYKKISGDNSLVYTPKDIAEVAEGRKEGDKEAAIKTFEIFGDVLGDAIANCVCMMDGLIVIGGGIVGAEKLFMPKVLAHLNGTINKIDGSPIKRIPQKIYHLDDTIELEKFIHGNPVYLTHPSISHKVAYDKDRRLGIAISKIGASEAIIKGAYAFALKKMDENKVFEKSVKL